MSETGEIDHGRVRQDVINGAAVVSTAGVPAALDTRLARFDAAADMPADITSSANVSASRIKFDTFSSTARKAQLVWHGLSGIGHDGTNTHMPASLGAMITINAGDDATANVRLTYTDLTGGGTSSSGLSDVIMIGPSNPIVDIDLDTQIIRIDAIGIPSLGDGASTFEACFLEIRVLG